MKRIHFLGLLMAFFLASCSSDSFKIDGNIANLDGAAVRVVFQGDSGMVDETVNLDKKGRFSFKGSSEQPVIVSLMDLRKGTVVMVVAANGDHIKVKGDASKALSVKAKGNKVNEEWQLFRDEHAAFYADQNPSRLNAAIEKYVREHHTDLLSSVLLMADYSDYSDRDKVVKMLKDIDPKARPESLIRVFPGNPLANRNNNLPRLMSLTLVKHGAGFEEVKLTGRVTLLSMWGKPSNGRETLSRQLTEAVEQAQGALSVIDILAESDTLQWHKTIAGETGPHYWAPGGPLEQGIQLLDITTLPWFAVTDSTGLVIYSGPSLDGASKKVLGIINK